MVWNQIENINIGSSGYNEQQILMTTTEIDDIITSTSDLTCETILSKQFEHLNIKVYGTIEDPLFKASEIGEVLDIKKIRTSIADLDDDCKVL